MTSLSYSLSRGALDDPDKITVGTSAPGSGDFELRVNLTTNTPTRADIILALEAFTRRLEDGRNTDVPSV
jgi:hypothetical protein